MSTQIRLLYITVPDRACGLKIARVLLEQDLIACANVLDGATSVFRWEGSVQEESEAIVIAKTRADLVEKATQAITDVHPYECACVIALEVGGGNVPFLDWIATETKDSA